MTSEFQQHGYRLFPDYAKAGGYKSSKRDAEVYETRMVAVDPGDVHVGVAVFGQSVHLGWECVWVAEMMPEEFEDWLSEQMVLGRVDILVVEQWRLLGKLAAAQSGSEMLTSQLIGSIKYIYRACKGTNRWPRHDAVLSLQETNIKEPAFAVLKNRRIKSMAKVMGVTGQHVLDAEAHGYHYIIHILDGQVVQTMPERFRAGEIINV